MTRYPSEGLNEYDVADTCRRAAWKFRSRFASGKAARTTQADSAVANLLEAVSRAVTVDRASIPKHLQRAALEVARQVQASGRPHASDGPDRGSGRSAAGRDMGWGAVQREPVPFATSIRLGRMG
jgi:hypothetical protein